MKRKCSKCKIEKDTKDFYRNKTRKDGYHNECKECVKKYVKKYRVENKEEIKIKDKKRYQENKNMINIRNNNYYQKNKDKIILNGLKNQRERLKTDINYKLSRILRDRLNKAVKGNYKSGSAVQDLGCSIPELKIYLESKFQDGMSWDNYGFYGWHIDHIIPLDSFNLQDRKQFLKACHYSNLQPLWGKENIIKGNR